MSPLAPTMSLKTRSKFMKWNPYGWNYFVEDAALAKAGFFGEWKEKEKPHDHYDFLKGDTPLLVDTANFSRIRFSVVYGKMAWDWVNREHNVFSLLPKRPWERSGERILTGDPATDVFQGVAETGALPDAQVPNYATHGTQFKQCIARFQVSRKMRKSAALGDDVLTVEELRRWAAGGNVLGIEKAICENAEATIAAGTTTENYTGKDTFEGLDRIISCSEEEDDLDTNHGTSYYDPWQQYAETAWDRDSGTTYDAIVVHGDGTYVTGSRSAFGTDATLTMEAVDVLLRETEKAGANPATQILVTGYDTYYRIKQLIETKQRFMDSVRVMKTVNGVNTVAGVEAGFPVASYEGRPIFKAANMPSDTISRIFCLDLASVYFKVVTPTILMAPDEAESYLGLDKLVQDHWFLTEGETWCTNVKVQGKLRSAK